nr:integrase, catalytic region, zinc finger, CCHC-type, peptidase aspartic, catalytic [Tanacetum cinerariifolium]
MPLEGSELTKEDRESQLYDDFEHFHQNKGETIHDYYVWFAKLINDMRNIKMTMSRMQLNSKFVNNMFPEWGRFVIAVKLNRGLMDSNYDQMYAYLKQHEAHANENKMMLDRFTQHTVDPLTLMSNGRQNRGQENNAWGTGAAGYGGAQNRVGNENLGQAGQIKCYNCNGRQDNTVDEDVDKQLAPTTQTMFMANLSSIDPVYDEASSSYDSDILSEATIRMLIANIMNNIIPYDQYVKDNVVSVVQISRFSDMHEAFNAAQRRIANLESANSHLKNMIQNDDHDELVEYVIGTCSNDFNKGDKQIASTPVTRKKQVTFMDPCETFTNNTPTHVKQQTMNKTNELVIPSTGVKGATTASESKPRRNTKKDRTLPAKSDVKKVEVHPRNNMYSVKRKNHVDSSISYKRTAHIKENHKSNCVTMPAVKSKVLAPVVQYSRKLEDSCQRILSSKSSFPLLQLGIKKHSCYVRDMDGVELIKGCTDRPLVFGFRLLKTYDGDHSRLMNFVKKFSGTVRFGNDHFYAIIGYGDYVIDIDGVELIKGSRGSTLYTISIEYMMKSSPICLLSKASKNKSWLWHRRLNHLNFSTINDLARKDLVRGLPRLKFEKDHLFSAFLRTPQQNNVVKRRNHTLVEAAKTMLIFSKAPMFLWAEAVATAFYTQNRSLIHTRHRKTPYELVHDKKPDLTFFRVFGALCYPTNDNDDLEKLQPTDDIGIFYRTRTYVSDAWIDKFRARTQSGSCSTLRTPVGIKSLQGVTAVQAGATTTMTAKLPILNLGEYDLWLMRIEQYFLMTDYFLWEVIKNGNKVLTKPVGSSEQPYEPTTAEEKLVLEIRNNYL